MGNLQSAHKGYRYQDLATAYSLVRGLSEKYDLVTVDRKMFKDDIIDDLEIVANGRKARYQFKSSTNANRALTIDDFTGKKPVLPIDSLVVTFTTAGYNAASEYRLCATWQSPAPLDAITAFLKRITVPHTVVGWASKCYRLQGELIWPEGTSPLWPELESNAQQVNSIDRTDFLAFCERFIIELELPIGSSNLLVPGPLEKALLVELADRVGIGAYPNHGRLPADVAELAVSLATIARTKGQSLTIRDVERTLGIRTDFGRVAQAFPLDKGLFHNRPKFRSTLCETALTGQHQLLIAPPGAGKSWELTTLAEELRKEGAIVARHYCYLEPGDELVEQRITTDVFFGNLLAELIEEAPELLSKKNSRYSADIHELEVALAAAVETNRAVILIVDGLDHISRIRANARSLNEEETDIVEKLGTLIIPKGVVLIIGSQPGGHFEVVG